MDIWRRLVVTCEDPWFCKLGGENALGAKRRWYGLSAVLETRTRSSPVIPQLMAIDKGLEVSSESMTCREFAFQQPRGKDLRKETMLRKVVHAR